MVTIQDIAKAVNKSHSTVSRALHNHSAISEKTRRDVKIAARELGYRPSVAARSLKSGKSMTIGLAVCDFMNPYYVEYLRHVENGCNANGYQLLAMEHQVNDERIRKVVEQFINHGCDGVILNVSNIEPARDLIKELLDSNVPVFMFGLSPDVEDLQVDGLTIDLSFGISKAIDYLVSLDHRNIKFVYSIPQGQSDSGRLQELEYAFNKSKLEFNESVVINCSSGNQLGDGYMATVEILKKAPETTAIICTNDFLAVGVLNALSTNGISVPTEMSVVGTDNTWICSHWPTPLTTIDQCISESAAMSIETILNRIENKEWGRPRRFTLHSDLIVRQSCSSPRS